jgi:hypothetical protein
VSRSGVLILKRYDKREVKMTIMLEFPPEAEASLIAQAKARGLSLDAFLRTIITTQVAAMESLKTVPSPHRNGIDLDQTIDELFDTVHVPPGVGEGAMRRDNWYR